MTDDINEAALVALQLEQAIHAKIVQAIQLDSAHIGRVLTPYIMDAMMDIMKYDPRFQNALAASIANKLQRT